MPFNIIRNDITKMHVDAIVNAANTRLQMGGGVCGAIFKAAGANELQAACDKLAPIETGEAVITPGFELFAKYIIHAVGPIYQSENVGQSERQLRNAYLNSLKCAVINKCESIAFPLISSGIYGYPRDEALRIATDAICDFIRENDIDVSLVIFDKESLVASKELLGEVQSYIDEYYVYTHEVERRLSADDVDGKQKILADVKLDHKHFKTPISLTGVPVAGTSDRPPLSNLIKNLDEPFSQTLMRLIDAKGKTDVEVYRNANLTRQLFSKIRNGKGYMPSKRTIIALAIALELSLDETDSLLKQAGYALSESLMFDVIITFFIVNGKYNVHEINIVLHDYDQPTLGM